MPSVCRLPFSLLLLLPATWHQTWGAGSKMMPQWLPQSRNHKRPSGHATLICIYILLYDNCVCVFVRGVGIKYIKKKRNFYSQHNFAVCKLVPWPCCHEFAGLLELQLAWVLAVNNLKHLQHCSTVCPLPLPCHAAAYSLPPREHPVQNFLHKCL